MFDQTTRRTLHNPSPRQLPANFDEAVGNVVHMFPKAKNLEVEIGETPMRGFTIALLISAAFWSLLIGAILLI